VQPYFHCYLFSPQGSLPMSHAQVSNSPWLGCIVKTLSQDTGTILRQAQILDLSCLCSNVFLGFLGGIDSRHAIIELVSPGISMRSPTLNNFPVSATVWQKLSRLLTRVQFGLSLSKVHPLTQLVGNDGLVGILIKDGQSLIIFLRTVCQAQSFLHTKE
jgi:hypothetical protein